MCCINKFVLFEPTRSIRTQLLSILSRQQLYRQNQPWISLLLFEHEPFPGMMFPSQLLNVSLSIVSHSRIRRLRDEQTQTKLASHK